MLRALVVLLLLANLAFYAWTAGWLGAPPRHGQREPERLQQQVRPETLTVLPAPAASAAVKAARAAALVCLETGPLAEAELAAAEAAVQPVALAPEAYSRVEMPAAPRWLVFAGRYPEAAGRRAREDELRRLGLSFETLQAPPELAPGFVLSRHPTREQAEAWLQRSVPDALRPVRVVELQPAPPPVFRLRVPRADAATADRLNALPADALSGGFRPCGAAG